MHNFSLSYLPINMLFILIILFPINLYANSENELLEKYDAIEAQLLSNPYGTPLYIESSNPENKIQGDVFGVLNYPYNLISDQLSKAENWCKIIPLHFNIKACTYYLEKEQSYLNLYTGRKHYEVAEDVFKLTYRFNVKSKTHNYLHLSFNAADGPFDTKNYKITFSAAPLEDRKTFIHFKYEYQYGFWANLATSTYLSTLGRNKTGFTIIQEDDKGKPIYIKGIRGIIERNAMRYFIAIKSYLSTLTIPINQRFIKKTTQWFDLTEKHYKQLHEMTKKEYIESKIKEQQDQLHLQKELDNLKSQ